MGLPHFLMHIWDNKEYVCWSYVFVNIFFLIVPPNLYYNANSFWPRFLKVLVNQTKAAQGILTGRWRHGIGGAHLLPSSASSFGHRLGTETRVAGGEGQLLVDGRSAKTPQKKSVLWWEILNFDWRAGMVDCCPSFHRLAKAGIAEKICCWWGPSPHPTHYCGNTWDPLSDLSSPTSIVLLPLQVFAGLSQFTMFINNQQRGWAGVLWKLMLR